MINTPTPYRYRPLSVSATSEGPSVNGISARGMRLVASLLNKTIPQKVLRLAYEKIWLTGRKPDRVAGNAGESLNGMLVESIERPPANETKMVGVLMESFAAAKRLQSNASAAYMPGPGWMDLLRREWKDYYAAIEKRNGAVLAEYLRNFFRNSGISGFWGIDDMYKKFRDASLREALARARLTLGQYEAWRRIFPHASVRELEAPQVGNPWGYILDGVLTYEPVFEYHYHARYISRLAAELKNPVVLEIGGGFGGLAYQLLKMRPGIKYVGIDLPENILLQTYYLSSAFPEAKILVYSENMPALDRDVFNQYDIVLLPNFALPAIADKAVEFVVNVRSLSEMSAETIEEYFIHIDRICSAWFFHENIFKARKDGLHGIPSDAFPSLKNFFLVAEGESRWPRYNELSTYPCRENLYLRRERMAPPPDAPTR